EGPVCRLWDGASGATVRDLPTGHRCPWLAFSPDGRLLATAGWGTDAQLWETATGKQVRAWKVSRSWGDQVAFSADGRTLAVAERTEPPVNKASLQLWDVDEGKLLRGFHVPGTSGVASLAFSPDGRRLVSGNWADGTILVWDTSAAQERPRPEE